MKGSKLPVLADSAGIDQTALSAVLCPNNKKAYSTFFYIVKTDRLLSTEELVRLSKLTGLTIDQLTSAAPLQHLDASGITVLRNRLRGYFVVLNAKTGAAWIYEGDSRTVQTVCSFDFSISLTVSALLELADAQYLQNK